jgi:hypothetical protein
MLGPGVQSRARIFILSGNNHPLFHALTVWPEGDSLRDYPMCQNSNEPLHDEAFYNFMYLHRGILDLIQLARHKIFSSRGLSAF